MTPKELNKSMTALLSDLLAPSGFAKKRIGRLMRIENDCQQSFVFYFTRMGSSNCYDLTSTLMFSFPEVDKLTSRFLGKEYDKLLPTGSKPFYTLVPGRPILKYKYCSDGSLEEFAEMVVEDFRPYALPFYERFNTLDKLEAHFDRMVKENAPMAFNVRTGPQGTGVGGSIAATLCVLERWEKLRLFLEETPLLLEEHRERIDEYLSSR